MFDPLAPYAVYLALALALLALLALLVWAVCRHGRRFRNFEQWQMAVDNRLDNLHGERRSREVQKLQLNTLRPPPLSEARTTEVTGDMLETILKNPHNRKDTE